MKKIKLRKALKLSIALLAVGSIVTGWTLLITEGQVDMSDPAAVAGQFVADLQAGYPHAAYTLTSSMYQTNIREDDFTNGVAKAAGTGLPQSKAQLFSTAVPSKSSSQQNQRKVVMNLAGDGQVQASAIEIVLVNDSPGAGKKPQWHIQAFTYGPGTAVTDSQNKK